MHTALRQTPAAIVKLAEVEKIFSSFGISAESVSVEGNDGSIEVRHEAERNGLILTWFFGLSRTETPEQAEDEHDPCVVVVVQLRPDLGKIEKPIIDLTYFPGPDRWEGFFSDWLKGLLPEEKLVMLLFGDLISDAEAFRAIAAMATIFKKGLPVERLS
jgi:hypothetical protein